MRSLGERYWHALIDTRPVEPAPPLDRRAGLWRRYWASLLGLPPSPPAAEERRRGDRRWPALFLRAGLLPVAVTGLALALGVTVLLPPGRQDTGGQAAVPTASRAASEAGRSEATQSARTATRPALVLDLVLDLPARGRSLWRITRSGVRPAVPATADFAVSGSSVRVDSARARTGGCPGRERPAAAPVTPGRPLCLRTRAAGPVTTVFGVPSGGRLRVAVTAS
ncbi:hypothetical protein MF672_024375 [Actinomadura sp. ATCC 31491]|uniref:Uncharacterized protein n=1 Tax=Actinomadura luzonensis TaxID=2805427 RepID=A0ABT0FX29_9ACTN|nr:hypothetical protein [Actinomadura luzonensis]MCK2216904.1 hypothetical protein [Actinomadura luzonensis]